MRRSAPADGAGTVIVYSLLLAAGGGGSGAEDPSHVDCAAVARVHAPPPLATAPTALPASARIGRVLIVARLAGFLDVCIVPSALPLPTMWMQAGGFLNVCLVWTQAVAPGRDGGQR